jgi:multidrug resistance efflux pump
MKKTWVVAAVLFLLAMTGCRDKIEPGTATVERPTVSGVTTMEIALVGTTRFHEATATVTAEVESMVASRIMGPVAAISVKEGDRVKAGQLLIVIDSEDISNKVAAAEAAYREAVQALSGAEQHRMLAENTYSRFKNLYDEKALSLQELDKLETQKNVAASEYERIQEMVRRAEAGLAEAKVFQGFKEIKSPIDGVITGRFIDPGTMAMPGMRLLSIEDTSRYRLEAEIDESFAGQITPGLDVEVEIRSLKAKLPGNCLLKRICKAAYTPGSKSRWDNKSLSWCLLRLWSAKASSRVCIRSVPTGSSPTGSFDPARNTAETQKSLPG